MYLLSSYDYGILSFEWVALLVLYNDTAESQKINFVMLYALHLKSLLVHKLPHVVRQSETEPSVPE